MFFFPLWVDGLCGGSKNASEDHGGESNWKKEVFVLPSICSLLWEDQEIWGGWENVPFGCAEVCSLQFKTCFIWVFKCLQEMESFHIYPYGWLIPL